MIYETSYGIVPVRKIEERWEVFLVCHAQGRYWSFPKGHSEEGEEPLQAAKRELFEETNLSVVQVFDLSPFVEEYDFLRNQKEAHKTVFYFLASVEGTVRLQRKEILDGRWFSLTETKETITYQGSQEIFSKVCHFLSFLSFP
ncbi:MAG: NUDIX domain-containing protein [Parachlamydiales bacterium]|nr:NUDIX domain-containing protein [Parachlamydiales bacterium]